ncbi:disease resistance protein RGA2-like [Hibiscus syriacus]|uniref:disease resistance protein RGA2-like n=1 Tax=Hibiscus syriacus TaxID=106335 RepID=UPI001921306C|nr:disease resistance protein RGA2-like [Hibiscus syriacus]
MNLKDSSISSSSNHFQTLCISFSSKQQHQAMAESIAFDIITKLSSPLLQQLGLWWNFKDDLQDLRSIVSAISAVLLDAEERSVSSNLVKDCLEKLKDALYDADDLLDDIHTEALRKDQMSGNKLTREVRVFFSSSNQFAYGLKMGRKIKAIKARLSSIQNETKMLNLVERYHPEETPFMAKRRQQTHSFVRKDEIIGRDDDKAALLKLLLEFESEENVYFIPIVGIGGLGKTALAQLVYNDETVKDHFELKMWVCVSDVFDVKLIVANIIKSVTNHAPDQNLDMDQLQKQLRDKIDGKKYLLVLDDIWNEEREQWSSLKKLLMGGDKGSRILVTSRSLRVAKLTSKCQPHVLRGLSDDDAWFLFKEIAFEQRPADSKNSAFVEVGKQILGKCGGVPLVIKAIAGTLSFKETENEWLSFKDTELARVSQNGGEILPTLKLSYDHLPSQLKHCFAYCRLYPKDHRFNAQRLVQFWIAQGFVKQLNPNQSLEEIGFGYFRSLVERSFFQEVEDLPWGMTCKMHDFMHDLAELVAGREISILDSNSSGSEVDEKCRHLSIDFSLIHLFKGKKLRTLLRSRNNWVENMTDSAWDWIISNCRCLRVLELRSLNLNTIPDSIHKLKHLRYLDLSFNKNLKILPKSICKTQNLQVLKLDYCDRLEELPKKIEKLVNLIHLGCKYCQRLTHMPSGIGKLTSLQTLSMFVVDKDGSHGAAAADLSELSGLNNLRGDLTITNLGFVRNAKEKFRAANLKGKQHLRELHLEWSGYVPNTSDGDDEEKSLEDLQPHPNLKELCVVGWRGDPKFPSWLYLLTNLTSIEIRGPSKFKYLPSFAQLPYLQRLWISELTELEYMHDNDCNGGQGESESFFPSLTFLTLMKCPNMKSWWKRPVDNDKGGDKDRTVIGASTMAFPCLFSLWIEDCPLTSMPLYPSLDELRLVNTSSMPLKHTIQMSTTIIEPSTSSLPLSNVFLKNIEELDPDNEFLQNLTSLEHLVIASCHWLKSLPVWLQQLSRLKSLKITDCKELDLEGIQWEPLKNLSRLEIDNLPQLVSLPLWLQHLVRLESLVIKNCSGLRSLFPVFLHLTFLESLKIVGCEELELSAGGIQIFHNCTSLRVLRLENIRKCRHLPEWLQHLTNLQKLRLYNLPNLTSLPDNMCGLTSLEDLSIRENPQLEERCRKDIGADWHKIAHIPEIWVNETRVQ